MRLAKPQAAKQSGFTLIEMLVVIAIIAVLASMIVAASMRVIGMQAQQNTNLEIQKLNNAVWARWKAVTEQATTENIPPAVQGNLPADPRLARLAYVALRLEQQFPRSFSDALNGPGNGLPPEPYYVNMLQGVTAPPQNPAGWNGPVNCESGICLWLILKNSSNGAIFNQDIFTPQETLPIPNSQVFCLVDGWRQPLQFQWMPWAQFIQTPQGKALANTNVLFDLDPRVNPQLFARFYFYPVIWSNGSPPAPPQAWYTAPGPSTINSYNLTIGGPIGG